jgi:hypothetical protein
MEESVYSDKPERKQKMKSNVVWAYRKGKWVTKLFGVLYWVKAYKKDLWHISDTLVNDIRNRDTYPNRYAKWTYCQNLKKGTSK